jgi:excisionase family DNA binding protein
MNESDSPNSFGRFLTLADTAEVLNISAAQSYALVRSGELPAIKIGSHGQWRVERSVLESYIEAMYEEVRRLSLWNQSDYANNVSDLGAGLQRLNHGSRTQSS